jgi:hypothetical protein
MGSSGNSQTPKGNTYDTSRSNQHHRRRTGYAQFDGIEMNSRQGKQDMNGSEVAITAIPVSTLSPQRVGIAETLDNTSEETILDHKGTRLGISG